VVLWKMPPAHSAGAGCGRPAESTKAAEARKLITVSSAAARVGLSRL